MLAGLTLATLVHQPAQSELGLSETINWVRGPDIPLPRGGYYAAWHKGGLVLAGGTYWKDKKKIWTDLVSYYNPVQGVWREWTPLPKPLAYGVMANVAGNLYLIGGIDETVLHHDIYKYEGEEWRKVGQAPAGVVYASAVTVGSRIFVTGGGTSNNDLTTATNQAWSYDPQSGVWEKLPGVPGPPRLVHAAGVLDKSIYIFGGLTQKSGEPYRNLDDAYKFDTLKKRWTKIRSLPQAARALWATSAGHYIYLFGGMGEKELNTVYRYNPSSDKYELVSQMPLPLMDTKFFYFNGAFYGAAGEDKAASRFSGLLIGHKRENVH